MASTSDIPAILLCGGLGLRLRSVISERPKCLAPISGRPFLHFLLAWLKVSGFRRVILCVGYKGEQIQESVGKGEEWNLEVSYAFEDKALGTAGALKNAERWIESDSFVALNGDTILEADFARLIRFHHEQKAVATLALWRSSDVADRYGKVNMDQAGRITGFVEKDPTAKPGSRAMQLINGGVYVFNQEIFAEIPQPPPAVSLETEIFPALIRRGLCGFPCEGYFLDIGIPEDYQRAQTELPERFR